MTGEAITIGEALEWLQAGFVAGLGFGVTAVTAAFLWVWGRKFFG